MNKIKYLIISFIVAITFFSCITDIAPEKSNYDINRTDTLTRVIKDGIILSCDSLQDSYTLDQALFTNVILENKSNKEGLRIHIGSYPPLLYWHILDSNEQLVAAGPTVVGLSVYDDTLRLGNVLKEKFQWFHWLSDFNEMYSGLKAFSGRYKLRLIFAGIPAIMQPELIKNFEITEIGEPLSGHLYRDYGKSDSVNYDFILRNRIKKEMILTKSASPSYIFFYNDVKKDTIYKYSFSLNESIYNMKGYSDKIITRFRNSKKYFIEKGITGAFRIIIKLNFVERVITDDNLLFIL